MLSQSGKCNFCSLEVQTKNHLCWLSLQQSRANGRDRKGDEVFPKAKLRSKKTLAGISLIIDDDLKYHSSTCMQISLKEQSGRFKIFMLSLRPGLLSAEVLLAPPSLMCGEACGHFMSFADSPAKCAAPPFLSWEISLAKTAVANNQCSLPTGPEYILPYLSAASTVQECVRCAVHRLCEVQSVCDSVVGVCVDTLASITSCLDPSNSKRCFYPPAASPLALSTQPITSPWDLHTHTHTRVWLSFFLSVSL